MIRTPGSQGKNAFQQSPQTPGPLGHRDAASPESSRWLIGNSPGPAGINDAAAVQAVGGAVQAALATLPTKVKGPGDPVSIRPDKVPDLVSFDGTKLNIGGIWGAIESGSTWRATDGNRLVFSATSAGVVYYEAGGFYIQPAAGFIGDVTTYPFSEAGRRCGFIKTVLEVEMKFLMGVIAGASGVGFALVVGTEVLEFMVEHKDDFPVWWHAWTVFLEVRRYLKTYAPTLYDKVFNAVFKKFLGDAYSQLENATTPEIVAFLVGVILGHLAEHATSHGALTPLFIIWTICWSIFKRFFLSVVPGAVSLTAKEYDAMATEMITKLKESDITLTKEDVNKIVDEVKKHPDEIKAAFQRLKDVIVPLMPKDADQ